MKISNSKKELARIISENGGWRDGSEFAAQDSNKNIYGARVCFYRNKPYVNGSEWIDGSNGLACNAGECIEGLMAINNWHQTILSRAEYFHLYPALDADGWIEFDGTERPSGYFNKMIDAKLENGKEITDSSGRFEWDTKGPSRIIAYRLHKPEQAEPGFCESVMRSITEPEAKPTIEQLAADYQQAVMLAEIKQQDADAAKADADAKLKELELAGEALGLLVSPITTNQEPGLVITDWRDLQVGDEVELTKLNGGGVDVGDVGVIRHIDINSMNVDFPSQECHLISRYSTKWKFIRRP